MPTQSSVKPLPFINQQFNIGFPFSKGGSQQISAIFFCVTFSNQSGGSHGRAAGPRRPDQSAAIYTRRREPDTTSRRYMHDCSHYTNKHSLVFPLSQHRQRKNVQRLKVQFSFQICQIRLYRFMNVGPSSCRGDAFEEELRGALMGARIFLLPFVLIFYCCAINHLNISCFAGGKI